MRQDPSSKWFDYKSHSCGLKYEFCLSTREPHITWVNGPIPPSKHDLPVFCSGNADGPKENWDKSALYFKFEDERKIISDNGYASEPSNVVVSKIEHSSDIQ